LAARALVVTSWSSSSGHWIIELKGALDLIGQSRALIDQISAVIDQLSQFDRQRILRHILKQQRPMALD